MTDIVTAITDMSITPLINQKSLAEKNAEIIATLEKKYYKNTIQLAENVTATFYSPNIMYEEVDCGTTRVWWFYTTTCTKRACFSDSKHGYGFNAHATCIYCELTEDGKMAHISLREHHRCGKYH